MIEYIKNQREHHAKQSFEDDYITLLKLNRIDYGERYLSIDSVAADAAISLFIHVPWVETHG